MAFRILNFFKIPKPLDPFLFENLGLKQYGYNIEACKSRVALRTYRDITLGTYRYI